MLLRENQMIISIIRMSSLLAKWRTIFSLGAFLKEDDVLSFLILGPYFGPKKDKLFYPVFVFRRCMSNAICDVVLYLQNKGLKHFMNIYPGTVPLQYLKTVFIIQYSVLSVTRNQLSFLKCDGSIWNIRGKFR